MTTTTRRYSTPSSSPKPFSWSYSKLKNYETCPKRHWHIDLKKEFREDSEQMKWGNAVHAALAQRIARGPESGKLPEGMGIYEPWAQRIFMFPVRGQEMDVSRLPGTKVMVEQEWAINADFAPCEWFGRDAWFRAKADVVWLNGPLGGVVDWKTGKIVEDSVQLMLTAAAMFAHYPQLQIVRSSFVWLAEDAQTDKDIKREEVATMWSNLWSRITALREAHEQTSYPPTPSFLCRRFCPVRQCPHHGEDNR